MARHVQRRQTLGRDLRIKGTILCPFSTTSWKFPTWRTKMLKNGQINRKKVLTLTQELYILSTSNPNQEA